MKRFYQDYNQVRVYQIKQLLDDAGIACVVRNELIQGVAGEVPLNEALPEVWLVDDEWEPKANRLLESFENDLVKIASEGESVCGQCNNLNENGFAICWHCQCPRA